MANIDSQQRQSEPEDRTRLSRRRAIRKRCLDCSAGSRKDVATCTMKDCDLYPFRMGKSKQNPQQRSKAIRQYCKWCCGDSLKEVRLCPSTDCPLYPYRLGKTGSQDASHLQKNATYGGDFEDRESGEGDTSSSKKGTS